MGINIECNDMDVALYSLSYFFELSSLLWLLEMGMRQKCLYFSKECVQDRIFQKIP